MWDTLSPFEYDKEPDNDVKLELRELVIFDRGEKYYGFW